MIDTALTYATVTVLDSFALTGKKALVTGGNQGLGKAFAAALAQAGAQVIIVARDAARKKRGDLLWRPGVAMLSLSRGAAKGQVTLGGQVLLVWTSPWSTTPGSASTRNPGR